MSQKHPSVAKCGELIGVSAPEHQHRVLIGVKSLGCNCHCPGCHHLPSCGEWRLEWRQTVMGMDSMDRAESTEHNSGYYDDRIAMIDTTPGPSISI